MVSTCVLYIRIETVVSPALGKLQKITVFFSGPGGGKAGPPKNLPFFEALKKFWRGH